MLVCDEGFVHPVIKSLFNICPKRVGTVSCALSEAPPRPFLPSDRHGRKIVALAVFSNLSETAVHESATRSLASPARWASASARCLYSLAAGVRSTNGAGRAQLLEIAYESDQRRLSVSLWRAGIASGAMTGAFACCTAAVITPVDRVKANGFEFTINNGENGAVTMALRDVLLGIQHGTAADNHGWAHPIKPM